MNREESSDDQRLERQATREVAGERSGGNDREDT